MRNIRLKMGDFARRRLKEHCISREVWVEVPIVSAEQDTVSGDKLLGQTKPQPDFGSDRIEH